MITSRQGLAIACVLLGFTAAAAEDGRASGWFYDGGLQYRSDDGRFEVGLTNQVQVEASATDRDLGDSGSSFDVDDYKLILEGRAEDRFAFRVQANLTGGSETSENLLEDAWIRYDARPLARIWAGQGKVPFGRQFMAWSGHLQFVDRSIVTERFAHGRDVGLSLMGENRNQKYAYSVGVYNGNGINRAANDNRDVMATARLVITPFGPCEVMESDPEWTKRTGHRLAIGVAALTNNVGTDSIEEERTTTGAFELAYKVRGFSVVLEFFTQNEDQVLALPGDEVETDGWYGQAGYLFRNHFEIAGRYAVILPDLANQDVTETGVAVGYYFRGHRSKLQADWRSINFEAGVPPSSDTSDRTQVRAQYQLLF